MTPPPDYAQLLLALQADPTPIEILINNEPFTVTLTEDGMGLYFTPNDGGTADYESVAEVVDDR